GGEADMTAQSGIGARLSRLAGIGARLRRLAGIGASLRRLAGGVAATLAAANAAAAPRWAVPDRAADRRLVAIVGIAALALFLMHYLVVNIGTGLPQLLWSLGFSQPAR